MGESWNNVALIFLDLLPLFCCLGYMCSQETGLYYLQSRYYNPELCRFISADAYVSTGQGILGHNMFAYCLNNPVGYADPSGTITIPTLILIGSIVFGGLCAGATAYAEYQAGFDIRTILKDSLLSGMSGFMFAYSLGTTAYQWYQQYCYIHGKIPRVEVFPPRSTVVDKSNIPDAAVSTLDYIESHNGAAPKGYKGGSVFHNDGRAGSSILPPSEKPYYEYDIHPFIKGQGRGLERIVIGAGGQAWYTPDHYKTFIPMR